MDYPESKNTIRTSVLFNMLLVAIMETIAISPYFTRNSGVLITYSLFLLWVASSVLIKHSTRVENPTKWWLGLVGYIVMMVVLGRGELNIFGALVRLELYCIPCIAFVALKYYNKKEKILLSCVSFLITLGNIIINDFLGYIQPESFSLINENPELFQSSNLGSTDFVVVCLFFYTICLFIFMLKGKWGIKLISVVSIVVTSYYFFYLNSRGTAFFMFLLILLSFFANPSYKIDRKNRMRFGMLLFAATIVILLVSKILLGFLYTIFDGNDRMIERFNEISDFTKGDKSGEGSLVGRIELASISLKTWTSSILNFIIGFGETTVKNGNYIASGAGHHSQIIDFLAYYGILGTYILFRCLKSTFSFFGEYTKDNIKVYNFLLLNCVAFIIYSFLNNTMTSNIMYVFMVQVPMIASLVAEYNDQHAG